MIQDIIERASHREGFARYALGRWHRFNCGVGDPHFPALLIVLAGLGVIDLPDFGAADVSITPP